MKSPGSNNRFTIKLRNEKSSLLSNLGQRTAAIFSCTTDRSWNQRYHGNSSRKLKGKALAIIDEPIQALDRGLFSFWNFSTRLISLGIDANNFAARAEEIASA